jgi:hypothetical protein
MFWQPVQRQRVPGRAFRTLPRRKSLGEQLENLPVGIFLAPLREKRHEEAGSTQ